MPHKSTLTPQDKLRIVLLLGLAVLPLLAACNSQSAVTPPGSATPLLNPPAVVQSTATRAPRPVGTTQPALPVVAGTEKWDTARRTIGGITYSFRYPQDWKDDLSYCPAGSRSSGLPAGCVITDFLVGPKAAGLGQISGQPLTVSGMRAVKQIDSKPRSGLASRIYTVMVYGDDGKGVFGYSTSIGPGTDQATQDTITSTLDKVTATLTVEK